MFKTVFILLLSILLLSFRPPENSYGVRIAVLKYGGGGDWYANPTSLPNLIKFCNKEIKTNINKEATIVEPGSKEIFNYPFVHLTGHGNIVFNDKEVENMRLYLTSGGFLHIDDNYGLDKYIRPQMQKVFPELKFVELPFDYPIYKQKYIFTNGPPKIHEHDGLPSKGFGLIYKGRLVCYYTYETDLGNGWESEGIYNDSESTRLKALQMGANIIQFVFNQ